MHDAPPPHGLDGVEIFEELGPAERVRLARELTLVSLRRGETLVRQHEAADALYVIVTGRFAITIDGRPGPIAELGPGQPVGEIAFLAGGARTATVTALRDGVALRLGRTQFEELSAKSPAIWRALTLALARRVAKANLREPTPPDPRPRTVTLIRAGDSALPAAFVTQLLAAFQRSSATLLLDAQRAQSVLPGGTRLDGAAATQALNALETKAAHLLYVADDELTAWSEKAIRQADLVLAVGYHSAATQPNALERCAAELLLPDAQRLVLLHATRGPISGTAAWLASRRIAMHHHVALDQPGDIERLYRFVQGSALGLVACGGGAYCAAHIGVYKALLHQGLTFDIMGGASGGSAMAAAFAMGAAPEDVDRATHEIFVTNKAMRRYTLPRYSLLDHTYLDRQLANYYAGLAIEDLWIPYFAISTDLSRHDLYRHRRGDLWVAVRASASVPVLLPPFYTADGHMLVDGAILNNVPVRIMHELKSGPNIVISFGVPRLERFDVDYKTLPGRYQLLKCLLNPLLRRGLPVAPGVATVLMRSLMASRQDFDRDLRAEDLLLVPPIPADMGVLDWHRHRDLAAASFGWTLKELARIRAQGHPALASGPHAGPHARREPSSRS